MGFCHRCPKFVLVHFVLPIKRYWGSKFVTDRQTNSLTPFCLPPQPVSFNLCRSNLAAEFWPQHYAASILALNFFKPGCNLRKYAYNLLCKWRVGTIGKISIFYANVPFTQKFMQPIYVSCTQPLTPFHNFDSFFDASSLDRIKMTKKRLEIDPKKLTMANLYVGTRPKLHNDKH